MNFPVMKYLREVILRLLPVSILAFILPGFVYYMMEDGWIRFIVLLLTSMIGTGILVYVTALEDSERQTVITAIRKVFVLK